MKDETKIWIEYAKENLESSKILLKSSLYNPCLQNIQQAVEKSLKALLIEKSLQVKRTHSIYELNTFLNNQEITIDITEEDCEFLDTIYLPSKYPIGNVLPDFEPNNQICEDGITIAEKVINSITDLIK